MFVGGSTFSLIHSLLRQVLFIKHIVATRSARDSLQNNNITHRLLRQRLMLSIKNCIVTRSARDNLQNNNITHRLPRQRLMLSIKNCIATRSARDNLQNNNITHRLLRQRLMLSIKHIVVSRTARDKRQNNNVGRRLPRQRLMLFILIFFTSHSAFAAQPLRIAVAANFAPVLTKLLPQFTEKTGITPQLISAGTGTLFQQLRHGAPFDVFLGADTLHAKKLADLKLILNNSRKTYAVGQIALYSANSPRISVDDLYNITKQKQRLAIANPRTAPYGLAAKQCLMQLNLWQAMHNHLIMGNNVGQTFQQVRSQAVPLGIVAYSQLKLNKLKGTLLPSTCYTPIKQQLVILKRTQHKKLAQAFSAFLLSANVQQQIKTFGYNSSKHANLPAKKELTFGK